MDIVLVVLCWSRFPCAACVRVGQCVSHRLHRYRSVIVGWDPECTASDKWMETVRTLYAQCTRKIHVCSIHKPRCAQMQVDRLPRGRKQPFYKLLVDSRDRQSQQLTYVAEENVVTLPDYDDEVQHPEIGRYFLGRRAGSPSVYIPNDYLQAQFPDDTLVAAVVDVGSAADVEMDAK